MSNISNLSGSYVVECSYTMYTRNTTFTRNVFSFVTVSNLSDAKSACDKLGNLLQSNGHLYLRCLLHIINIANINNNCLHVINMDCVMCIVPARVDVR